MITIVILKSLLLAKWVMFRQNHEGSGDMFAVAGRSFGFATWLFSSHRTLTRNPLRRQER